MKKFISLLLLSVFIGFANPVSARFAEITISKIKKGTPPKGSRPRTLQIVGKYDIETNILQFIFLQEIGQATVYIDHVPYYLSGSAGTQEMISLPSSPLNPVIRIVCSSGDEFEAALFQ
ncbi:hypothetical protein LJC12_04810 [Odoribacter sp. OttesenSCG-928-J03]|nr:hypothetical protein [Odoribacter sp. OttesenSCG-928-J03]